MVEDIQNQTLVCNVKFPFISSFKFPDKFFISSIKDIYFNKILTLFRTYSTSRIRILEIDNKVIYEFFDCIDITQPGAETARRDEEYIIGRIVIYHDYFIIDGFQGKVYPADEYYEILKDRGRGYKNELISESENSEVKSSLYNKSKNDVALELVALNKECKEEKKRKRKKIKANKIKPVIHDNNSNLESNVTIKYPSFDDIVIPIDKKKRGRKKKEVTDIVDKKETKVRKKKEIDSNLLESIGNIFKF